MRMEQGVRTGLGHGGITCVLQTQFSIFFTEIPIDHSNNKTGVASINLRLIHSTAVIFKSDFIAFVLCHGAVSRNRKPALHCQGAIITGD